MTSLVATGITVVLAGFGALVPASPAAAAVAEPPRALPQNATTADLKWQPALDYDTDGCYNVPAIGPDGEISWGLDHNYTTGAADCRDQSDLDNSNAYSRQRCNSGWCVYLYAYYYEKDVAVVDVLDAGGHVHDWEHIAVWVHDDKAEYVAVSQHGHYEIKSAEDVLWEGTHPKVVYHKAGGSTHAFRYARSDDEPPENHYQKWMRSPLVSYNGFPSGLRDRLMAHDFDSATLAIKDASFAVNLERAIPTHPVMVCPTPGSDLCDMEDQPEFAFDYTRDEGSPGDPPVDPPPTQPGTLRVMVVGDSMSQGHEGDYTWRYRLWEWFRSQHVPVDFVGPYHGTMPPAAPKAPAVPALQGETPSASAGPPDTSGSYAPPAQGFDGDHFSVWGRQAAQDKDLIRKQVEDYRPDLLLTGLGFNDMGWFVSGPEGTLASMKALVDGARAAKPDIKFALANVPQRTGIGGREDLPRNTDTYNRLLRDAIPSWSTSRSPVELVDWRSAYDCEVADCPAGYDGLHPNALGEYQIAQAFERTLHDSYRLGSDIDGIPSGIPSRPTSVPRNVVASPSPGGVTVTWDPVFGAFGYTLRSRLAGATSWTETRASSNRHDTTWTTDGQKWEYQVRTDNGNDLKSDWSATVSATAHPKTSPPPVGIVTRATATGVDVVWGAPTGDFTDSIDRYQILAYDTDIPGAFVTGTAVKGKSVHIDDLVPGHHYVIAVATWNAAGGGMPGNGRSVTVGAGTPPAPTGLKVTSTDPTTVQLTWTGSEQAAGYRVWTRNINNGSQSTAGEQPVGTTTSTGVAYLYPGTWNYEFCVTAINGAAESGKSNCVVAPRPAGS